MSLLRGFVLPCACVLWLLCAALPVFCQSNSTQESQCTEMLFRQAQDLGSLMADMKTMIMHQSRMHGNVIERLEAMESEIKTLRAQQNKSLERMDVMDLLQNSTLVRMDAISEQVALLDRIGCEGNKTGWGKVDTGDRKGPMSVPCDGRGWVIIQQRVDGAYNFPERNWADYKNGFGNYQGSFWLGLEKIYRLTSSGGAILKVEMQDFNDSTAYAQYSSFKVESESHGYRLRVSGYTGTAGDSLSNHDGQRFSTVDRDNDPAAYTHCAQFYQGAWWFNSCLESNLNSRYFCNGTASNPLGSCMIWSG